jgi:hypothetical protein
MNQVGKCMKQFLAIALLANLVACTTISSLPSDDAPVPVKAAAIVADVAVTWRIWELLGYVK